MNDIILTGIPRSGTTLTCHLLNKVSNTVALHEPLLWDDVRDPTDHRAICDGIEQFFHQTRKSCLASGTAITKHTDGLVPDNPMGDYPVYSKVVQALGRLVPGGIGFWLWVSGDHGLPVVPSTSARRSPPISRCASNIPHPSRLFCRNC